MVRDGAGELPEGAGSAVGQGGLRQAELGAFGAPSRTILSPLAGFIAANYGLPFDLDAFAEAGRDLLDGVEAELGWMYETLHTDGETTGRIDYTVWSEVFRCPECAAEVVFRRRGPGPNDRPGKGHSFPCPRL